MSIKVILTEAIEHLGGAGDICNVAPGYARNYLFPKRIALEATEGNLKSIAHKRKVWEAALMKEVEQADSLKQRLDAIAFDFKRRAGETGTLFGSVTNQDVAELLLSKGIDLDRRMIQIKSPIKSLGEHEVNVRLHRKLSTKILIRVEPEGEVPKPVEAEAEGETEGEESAADAVEASEAAEAGASETADAGEDSLDANGEPVADA